MDLVTHSMTGMFLGAAAARGGRDLKAMLAAAVIASALPDLDAALYLGGAGLYYHYHRLFTHTLFALPVIAAPAAWAGWKWGKGSRFMTLYLLAVFCLLVPLGLDVLCDWPVLLFYPLRRTDFARGYIQYSSPAFAVIITALALAALFLRRHRPAGQA
ncbi:MAG TPA: metal-dependent hydrolase [bacterium]|nr:metal-dependent hydrolase [bacterium]